MVVYGGDEVSAIVLDIGSHTTRAGYAGEDVPKCVIPTAHGYLDEDSPTTEGGKVRKYFVGEEGPNGWRAGMEVGSMMNDGIVADPSALPSIVNHALHHRLRVDPSSHPLLTTEPAWNTPKNRETMAELVFEQEGVPAWYTACSGVLSAFASGKGTALVVDIGSEVMSVTPVCEGYVLRVGTRRQPLAMTLLQSQMKAWLESAPQPGRAFPLDLTPHQLIKTRTPVPALQPPKATLREDRLAGTTASWKEYQQTKVVEGWRESCAAVLETPYDERYVLQRPTRPFEFPDGYNAQFGAERFRLSEGLFNPNFIDRSKPVPVSLRSTPSTPHSNALEQIVSISKLAAESVMACDLDVRAGLLSNIILVGGGSLLPGVTDRFNWEMAQLAPGQKIRIHAPGHSVERRYSTWLGGSILASLGTFHQLWISKEEWKESGPNIIAQRCK